MKSWAQIMEEAGFSASGSPGVKAAFVKYLIKQTHNQDVQIPQIIFDLDKKLKKAEPVQMEFQLEEIKIAK